MEAEVRLKEKGMPALDATPISWPVLCVEDEVRFSPMLVKLKLSPLASFIPAILLMLPATLLLEDCCEQDSRLDVCLLGCTKLSAE